MRTRDIIKLANYFNAEVVYRNITNKENIIGSSPTFWAGVLGVSYSNGPLVRSEQFSLKVAELNFEYIFMNSRILKIIGVPQKLLFQIVMSNRRSIILKVSDIKAGLHKKILKSILKLEEKNRFRR